MCRCFVHNFEIKMQFYLSKPACILVKVQVYLNIF